MSFETVCTKVEVDWVPSEAATTDPLADKINNDNASSGMIQLPAVSSRHGLHANTLRNDTEVVIKSEVELDTEIEPINTEQENKGVESGTQRPVNIVVYVSEENHTVVKSEPQVNSKMEEDIEHRTTRTPGYTGSYAEEESYESININSKRLKVCSNAKTFVCVICSKQFPRKSYLVRHIKRHQDTPQFFCKICEKPFKAKRNLVLHERTHTGLKPYCCDICNKQFTQKMSLTLHKRRHKSLRAFSCVTCNKQFIHKYLLTVHERVHTGETPYTCEVCEKRFTQKCRLTRHKLIHSEVKPYCCKICNRQFTQKGNFDRHRLAHTE